MMVVAPSATYARTASGYNIQNRIEAMIQALTPRAWFGQYGTVHQQLGIDLRQHLGSGAKLRALELEAVRNTPRPFNSNFKGFTAEQLLDDGVRAQALREYRAVMENLARSMGTSFDQARIDRIVMEEYSKRLGGDSELRNRLTHDKTQFETRRLRDTIRVQVMQQELAKFKDAAGSSNSMSAQKSLDAAKAEYSTASRIINNPVMGRLVRFLSGEVWASRLSFMRPGAVGSIPGAATAAEIGNLQMTNVNARDFIEEIKQGRVTMTRMTALMLGFMFISSVYKMVWAYEGNPNAGEEAVRMFLRPAVYLMGVTYFMGANAAHYGSLETMRQAVMGLDKLFKMKNSIRYETFRAQFKVQMAAISYVGMAGGLIAAQVGFKFIERLTSCNRLLDDRPIEERRISEMREQELQVLCQKSLYDFSKETVSDPKVQNLVLGMWTAKTLLALSEPGKLLAALSPAKRAALSGLSRGGTTATHLILRRAAKPVLRLGAFLGGSYTAIFLTIGMLATMGIGFIRYEHSVKSPIRRYKKNLIELAEEWRSKNWDATGICRKNWFFDGLVSGTGSQLTAGFRSDLDLSYCDEHLMEEFLNSHYGVLDAWRKSLLKPSHDAVRAWIKNTSQTLNTYHATKMFFRDIVTQVQLQRQGTWSQDFQIPRKHVPGKPGFVQDDSLASFDLMTQHLPLFRSSPFYGWHMNIEFERKPRKGHEFGGSEFSQEKIVNGVYETELVDPHSHKIMKWDEWMQSASVIRPLGDRWLKFQEDHLPAIKLIVADLEEIAKREEHRAALVQVNEALEAGGYESIVYGLQLISYHSELERTTRYCQKSLDPEKISKKRRMKWCPMSYLQTVFLDKSLYNWDEELERYRFRGLESNRAMGFNSNMGVDPFGMKPLSAGQQYLIEYEARFERAEVDPDFYEIYDDGMSAETMTEYLLKQMICGVKPDVTKRNLQRKKGMTRARLTSPQFTPPSLPLKKDLQLCAGFGSQVLTNIGPQWTRGLGKSLGSRGWDSDSDFYHSITDKRGPEHGAYAGIVDLLYNELDLEAMGDFDQWWNTNVKPQFEIVMDEKVKEFQDSVIGKKLKTALERTVPTGRTIKKGVIESLSDHLNTYFELFLDPMSNELDLDKRFVPDGTTNSEARQIFLAQYQKKKDQFYEVFNMIKGEKSKFDDEELQEKFQKRLNEIMESEVEIKFSEGMHHQPVIQVLVAYELAMEIIYDFKVLFKANDSESYAGVVAIMRDNLNTNVDLSEEAKGVIEMELLDLELEIMDDFETDAYRMGKVILTHDNISDVEGVYIYPRADVLKVVFTGMELIFIEVFDVLKLRDDFRTLKDVDSAY